MKIDLAIVARDLKLPPEKVEKTVELLDDGNTIPFITRFRKDLTGGLNEQQVLGIKQRVVQLRALAERKAFVLKSIESQNKLSDKLKTEINKASSSRRLEDLYLPFKPKKQSRASLARQQGLEPLAEDIFTAASPDVDIATRATEFVRVDKGLTSVDDVIKGVGDLLAEKFSEHDELRSSLRKILWNEGKLSSQNSQPAPASNAETDAPVSTGSEPDTETKSTTKSANLKQAAESPDQTADNPPAAPTVAASPVAASPVADSPLAASPTSTQPSSDPSTSSVKVDDNSELVTAAVESKDQPDETKTDPTAPASAQAQQDPPEQPTPLPESSGGTETAGTAGHASTVSADQATTTPSKPVSATPTEQTPTAPTDESNEPSTSSQPAQAPSDATSSANANSTADVEPSPASGDNKSDVEAKTDAPAAKEPVAAKPKKKKKKKKKKQPESPFKDYFDFKQSLKQIPNHRVLAINRGERAGTLKVKIEVDGKKLTEMASHTLVADDHPFKEFLQKCATDALNRLILPSLEREIRRELTETAEKHAIEVFANNLRNLLLQPPIRNRRVLAIDPGFKRGCSVAVLDACGNLLDSGHVFVVGNQTRREESKQKIADWVKQHQVDVIAIGNGAACRQTEQMVSDTIAAFLTELQTTYVMVNEAGASIYSTSEIGREEMPDASPSIRSATSIGRRLQDPLSELVKISPAHIGVGMYQHDVKAKHLSDSLDEVVRFCVNRVGVDVNTASPSLLKYVSGLNSLTARRVVEYRQANGSFANRNQLKDVSGFGDATFVQSAGFLRIHGGDTPLDCTSIHPESYGIANAVLEQIGVPVEEFFPKPPAVKVALAAETASNQPVRAPENSKETSDSNESMPPAAPTSASPEPVSKDSAKSGESEPGLLAQNLEIENTTPTPDATPKLESSAEAEAASPVTSKPVAAQESGAEPDAPPATEDSPSLTAAGESPSPAVAAESSMAKVRPDNSGSVNRKENLKKISELDVEELAKQHSAGTLLIKDILLALKRPKWDPRDKVAKPIFRRGIIKPDDLAPNMQLDGQVVNVVDFGVFVDIGLGESSLVHVSQLSNHFIRDPHRLFSIGDVLKVWVSEVDSERRRVKLTAVRPGSKKPQHRRGRGSSSPSQSSSAQSSTSQSPSRGSRSGSQPARKPGKYGGGPSKRNQRSGQRGYGKSAGQNYSRRPSKPKEVKPITEGMLKGKEPMRSFSDLAQFVNKKPDPEKNEDKDDKKS